MEELPLWEPSPLPDGGVGGIEPSCVCVEFELPLAAELVLLLPEPLLFQPGGGPPMPRGGGPHGGRRLSLDPLLVPSLDPLVEDCATAANDPTHNTATPSQRATPYFVITKALLSRRAKQHTSTSRGRAFPPRVSLSGETLFSRSVAHISRATSSAQSRKASCVRAQTGTGRHASPHASPPQRETRARHGSTPSAYVESAADGAPSQARAQ